MRIAVKDSSILIDLAEGNLLGLWFQLEIETHATDFVLREVARGPQGLRISPFVDAGLILRHETLPGEMVKIVEFSRANGISVQDASGVLLARHLEAVLLTGDRKMRRTAEAAKIEAKGLLWIFDMLVERRVLSGEDAVDRLAQVRAAGSRLPIGECESRIKAWRTS